MGSWQRQLIAYHPIIGWWFVPNLKAMVPREGRPYLIRTNSLGMRSDHEYSTRRSSDRRRIVVLGDSYTAGDGVMNNQRFSDLLQHRYQNLEIMNFGLSGSGTDQQVLIYETLARRFDADAYIFAPCTADILRNELGMFPIRAHGTLDVWYRPKPYFTLDGDNLVLHNQPVPNENIPEEIALKTVHRSSQTNPILHSAYRRMPQWMRQGAVVDRISRVFAKYENREFDSGYASEKSGSWRLMRAILRRFTKETDGKPVFLVPLPTFQYFIWDQTPIYLDRFKELHDPTKSSFMLDVLPYFKQLSHADRQKCYNVKDSHYSELGHKVVANCISDGVKKYCPNLLDN